MHRVVNFKKSEDFCEKAYLVVRLIMKNIGRFKLNEKFLKISFLDSKILLSMKILISIIKKTMYQKIANSKKFEDCIGSKIHSKNNGNLFLGFHQIGSDFLSKSAITILKFTEKCKLTFSKSQIYWKLNKRLGKIKKQPKQFFNLNYKKAFILFCRGFYNKKNFSWYKILKSLLFFDCFSEYSSTYIF